MTGPRSYKVLGGFLFACLFALHSTGCAVAAVIGFIAWVIYNFEKSISEEIEAERDRERREGKR